VISTAQQREEGGFLDFLADRGVLDAAELNRIRGAIGATHQPVEVVLLELGLLQENKLAEQQAAFLGLDRARPEEFLEDFETAEFPADFMRRMELVPLQASAGALIVATARPLRPDPVRALSFFLKRPVAMRVATHTEITQHLKRTAEPGQAGEGEPQDDVVSIEEDIERLRDVAREAPVIRLVARLIGEAVERGASDIHIEPHDDRVRVRLRIDGVLVTSEDLPKQVQAGVISRIKIMARLNIAEHRLPQDGRIKLPIRGNDIDLRVSTVPTLYGESLVMRILDREDVRLDFASLGFSESAVAVLRKMIHQPNGIVLVTGPTGSGKTTTLYAALAELNRGTSKIFTVEDPVEYHFDGINQTHVRPQIGLDFATVLRSVLRQDPDIIMVGEIRDRETANVAIQASLTGHLVLSTLHTNSAAAAISRLLDMGLEDYLLASTLRGILAQRLVRKLCRKCGPCPPGQNGDCQSCHGIGYSGRTVIYELLPIDSTIRTLITSRAADVDLERAAITAGMATLAECGRAKAASGETTLEEVARVTATL
jgi:general secretion pathway protein E